MYSFNLTYDPWEFEYDELSEDDTRETYSSDERFGPERQADRELTREMTKYAAAPHASVDWSRAACEEIRLKELGIHPDQWHSPWDSKPSAEAAGTCFECPIRLQCLKYACTNKEEGGIWGGLPARIRTGFTREHRAHDYEVLSALDNPYDTDNGSYASFNLLDWTPGINYEGDKVEMPEGTPIPGHAEYMATANGQIWHMHRKARILYTVDKRGHLIVRLRREGTNDYSRVRVDHIISTTYLDYPADSGYVVHHINGDATDNRVENLTWEPLPENPDRTRRLAGPISHRENKKLTAEQKDEIRREHLEKGTSHLALAEAYGVARTTIGNILRDSAEENQ
ncbi:WhiB family transcriptional regulator [Streptomyces sp. ISL-10]|uniref:WhiB family transcriptional regulator n=1 Tax=Streptomyces sp. ISL-10 TaxID=2819172 RepID=UPI001BE89C1D|nr:WhiB family transcriptional regulator [Streptomyces sp. ISL-10]MBT2365247.1 WhiB family transcriptional regulator [Streptomyces sp. ISL-10]